MSFTGNPSYVDLAAVSIGQSINQSWRMIWTSAHPVLAKVYDSKLNFNRGFSIKGLHMLLGVMGDDQDHPVDGVATGAGELVAMSYNVKPAISQWQFNFAHYRGNYVLLDSEAKLAKNGVHGNLLEGKKKQMAASHKKKLSTHLSSTTADAADNSRILGVYQPLSTSNTVGGISQVTDPQAAAYVNSNAGLFDLSLIDDCVDALGASNNEDRMIAPDLALCSYTAANNVYGKVRSSIAPAERFENKDFAVKYGIKNFNYMGIMFAQDQRIGASLNGSIAILSSAVWYVAMEKQMTMHAPVKIPATDAYEVVGTAWCALGTNDPGANGLIRDIR